jgi:hypothetical protein
MLSVAPGGRPRIHGPRRPVDTTFRHRCLYLFGVYLFLSAEWIAAARELHDEFAHRISPPEETVRMNVTVVDAPFDEGEVLGHLDTTQGSVIPREGHLDEPDVAIRLPYEIARQLLVEQQYEMLMISFMSGEIEVQGDVTMVMALQDVEPTAEQQQLAQEVIERLLEITE